MPGYSASRRAVILNLAAWTLVGVLVAALLVVFQHARWPNSLLFALPLTLLYSVLAGYSAYYVCRANPFASSSTLRILFVVGLSALLSGYLWLELGLGWNEVLLLSGREWAGFEIDTRAMALLAVLGAVMYLLAAATHYLRIESQRAAEAEKTGLEARLAAQIAELRLLRTQIEPHFLFNSLNSISALTSVDPARARRMTLLLADFFRQGLGLAQQDRILLAAELQLSRDFLAIEQVRFGERLRFTEEVGEDALACQVPPMLIQPLVENAVKHGVAHLTEDGWIRVEARRRGEELHIVVENAVDDTAPPPKRHAGSGLGQENVRQRLTAAFGDEAHYQIERRPGAYRVSLRLPIQGD